MICKLGWSQPDKWSGICGGAFSTIYYGASKRRNVMLRCGVLVITMGMVGRFLMISQKIVFGSAEIENKKNLVNFFDGITGLMQMLIFFLLGLLSFPSKLPHVIVPALLIFMWLTFVARPLSVALVLTPFRSKNKNSCCLSHGPA